MAVPYAETGISVFVPPTLPEGGYSPAEQLQNYREIAFEPEISAFLSGSTLWKEIISEASGFGDFAFHAHVVSGLTAHVFASALSQLKTTEEIQEFSSFFPYVMRAAFLHDIAKASNIDNLRVKILISPPYGQNGRPDKAILEDHLHALLGGLFCHFLGVHPIITELVGGHHEQANGHYITFDNRQQLSYPRKYFRNQGLQQLAQECLQLGDLAASMGFMRPYRKYIFNSTIIESALSDQLEQQTSGYYTDQMRNALLASTLKNLEVAQQTYGTGFLRTAENSDFFISPNERIIPNPPFLIDRLFFRLLETEKYNERIKHFKSKHTAGIY